MSKENKTKAEIIGGACCGILMLVCVIVYLILGMTLDFWHPGWLIPACGGISCGIIGIVSGTISDLKKLKRDDDANKKEENID